MSKQKKITWQEVYKLPLQIDNFAPFMVWTADKKRAFDFLSDGADWFHEAIVESVNGTPYGFDHKFSYDNRGIILYDDCETICIRGWGYLTGIGGLNLSDEEACKIQDEFAEYIVKQLNQLK